MTSTIKVRDLIRLLAELPPTAADADVFVWDAGERLGIVGIDDSFLDDSWPYLDLQSSTPF
jgi:hypothetical protein